MVLAKKVQGHCPLGSSVDFFSELLRCLTGGSAELCWALALLWASMGFRALKL